MVKPFALEQRRYPINQPIHHAGAHTIHDHRAGDGEHFGSGAEDHTFCLCQLRTQCF